MAVMVVHHTPTLTQERYETVVRGLTGGKQRLDSPADVATGGLLVHVAARPMPASWSSTSSSPRRLLTDSRSRKSDRDRGGH
jgi:hypothetical protein